MAKLLCLVVWFSDKPVFYGVHFVSGPVFGSVFAFKDLSWSFFVIITVFVKRR